MPQFAAGLSTQISFRRDVVNGQRREISQHRSKCTGRTAFYNAKEFIDVLHIYVEDSLSLMNDIHSGLNNGHEQILLFVHSLKSIVNNAGARRLVAVAQKQEMPIKQKNMR